MNAWWRRQRTTVIALVVAATACAGVHVWLDVLPAAREDTAIVVTSGQAGELAGQRVSLTSTVWDEFETPAGMRSLSVLLRASGGEDASICGATSLSEPGTGREWLDGRSLLDVPRERGESSCTGESGSYDVLAVFVLPDDATGPFELDMPGEGDVIRFRIAP